VIREEPSAAADCGAERRAAAPTAVLTRAERRLIVTDALEGVRIKRPH
jgi:hypothetical protein